MMYYCELSVEQLFAWRCMFIVSFITVLSLWVLFVFVIMGLVYFNPLTSNIKLHFLSIFLQKEIIVLSSNTFSCLFFLF